MTYDEDTAEGRGEQGEYQRHSWTVHDVTCAAAICSADDITCSRCGLCQDCADSCECCPADACKRCGSVWACECTLDQLDEIRRAMATLLPADPTLDAAINAQLRELDGDTVLVSAEDLAETMAAALGHVLAHGRHERGCADCDAGRAALDAWLRS